MPKQITMRGKERNFKPAKNVQDITTTRDLTITFRSVDSDLNYWLMFDIINYAQQKIQTKDFTMTFHFNFYDIEFSLNKSKVIELGALPTIIQRI